MLFVDMLILLQPLAAHRQPSEHIGVVYHLNTSKTHIFTTGNNQFATSTWQSHKNTRQSHFAECCVGSRAKKKSTGTAGCLCQVPLGKTLGKI